MIFLKLCGVSSNPGWAHGLVLNFWREFRLSLLQLVLKIKKKCTLPSRWRPEFPLTVLLNHGISGPFHQLKQSRLVGGTSNSVGDALAVHLKTNDRAKGNLNSWTLNSFLASVAIAGIPKSCRNVSTHKKNWAENSYLSIKFRGKIFEESGNQGVLITNIVIDDDR